MFITGKPANPPTKLTPEWKAAIDDACDQFFDRFADGRKHSEKELVEYFKEKTT